MHENQTESVKGQNKSAKETLGIHIHLGIEDSQSSFDMLFIKNNGAAIKVTNELGNVAGLIIPVEAVRDLRDMLNKALGDAE